ncbi:hypothetical protein EXU48_07550 [Occultella glacieicola]|uniref:SAF domain-containing protein n=1 Tax=Occultella glacieicola TaxID=2518684 RepID=A0ABY2E652_9MICO|nr:hypothetical protein [Occultella glacieicola]TDE96082.1 hypothetical protein EXU48_07550 [Occultella glacieicola]
MPEPSAPAAARLRRPSWRDPRLGIGILLVAASVALGSWAVTNASDTVEVYRTHEPLSPGDPIEAADLEIVQVHVPDVDLYLTPDQGVPEDAVATRAVGPGELVPGTAVGTESQVEVRPISLPMSAALEAYLEKGSRVDLWVALPDPDGEGVAPVGPTQLLVGAVEVWDVHEDASLFAGADQVQVQVLIEVDDLPEVLDAISADAVITVVPLPGQADS